jgi:polyphenol oxidase
MVPTIPESVFAFSGFQSTYRRRKSHPEPDDAIGNSVSFSESKPPALCATLPVMPFHLDSDSIYRVSELDSLPWLIHGFGTRHSDILANFGPVATLKQIHSADCVAADGRTGVLGEGDALLENAPGSVIAVKTADCIPLLLVDDVNRAVAAVHAGWRGTVAQIARAAVDAMRSRFGTASEHLHAAIGPAIGNCCFEVGPEVAAQFGREGRVHIDLAQENRSKLLEAGVTAGRIYASNLCTMCGAGEFHSFRRDRERAGRMYSFVGLARTVQ